MSPLFALLCSLNGTDWLVRVLRRLTARAEVVVLVAKRQHRKDRHVQEHETGEQEELVGLREEWEERKRNTVSNYFKG